LYSPRLIKNGKQRLVWMLLCVVLMTPYASLAAGVSETAYQSIKKDVTELRQNAKARTYRHSYEKLIRRFEGFIKKHPQVARSDDALFMTAQLWDEMSRMSELKVDREQAVRAYKQLRKKYPKSNLVDDALYKSAKLKVDLESDSVGAMALLEQIVNMGRSRADLFARAVALKTELQTQNAKPLGPVAVSKSNSQVVVPSIAAPKKQRLRKVIVDRDNEFVSLVLSGPVEVKRGDIPKRKNTPRRVYLDLTPAQLAPGVGLSKWVGSKGIIRLRLAQYDRTTVRVVAELSDSRPVLLATDAHVGFSVTLGFDFQDTSKQGHDHDELAKAKPLPLLIALKAEKKLVEKPAASTSKKELHKQMLAEIPPVRRGVTGLRRVVIDAGHGGKDPGAVGVKGTREKDLTLAIAKRIKAQMARDLPEVEVIMTREKDKFLPLKSRTQKANEVEADIFISIHINASVNRRVRGVETYYLNVAHDRYAKRLSARENAMTENDISDLEFILADLMMKSNVNESIRLGKSVQNNVVSSLHKTWPDVRDLGLRHALFYVLLGARMPAILVESSFVSNKKEEQRLKTAAYQDAIAQGVVNGVRRFINEAQAQYVPVE
jgi:N-acetylmuramoyl-L-alanine amidase